VYGSVIARDSIDYKCIYLFQRHRDDCQPIKLKVHSCLKVCSNWILFYSAVHLILTVIYGTSKWSHRRTSCRLLRYSSPVTPF
jgi:hypothetical protein